MEQLQPIATPSTLTCPDCGGSLWEMNDARALRYRCHTGHAFAPLSLERAQQDAAEHALWNAVRALRERELLLRRFAAVATSLEDAAQAAAALAQADLLQEQTRTLQRLAEGLPAAHAFQAAA
jgi:two-component system, chemotaxis family, protein-glutamate methylesterase/glutaminase